jgi:hypothetical protein
MLIVYMQQDANFKNIILCGDKVIHHHSLTASFNQDYCQVVL